MPLPRNSSPDPPPTRRDETTERLHGTELADPYRWLESDDEPVREWTAAQNDYADALLDSPTRDSLRSRVAALADVAEYGTVEAAGGRYFRTIRESGDDRARLVAAESPGDDGALLVEPDDWDDARGDDRTHSRSIAWHLPAPDGDLLAYGVAGGDERVDIHVVSVPDAEEVAVREDCGRVTRAFVGYDPTSPGTVAWNADGDGLYYVATSPGPEGSIETELRHWRFGEDDTEATLLRPDDRDGWPLVRTDPESGTLAVAFHDSSGTDWWVRADGEFRPVLKDSDAETFAVFCGETVFLQTDHEAPRKRLLACSLSAFRAGDLSLSDCETVLPEREAVLQSVAATPDLLVARYAEDARARLAVYDRDGDLLRDLSVPDNSSVSKLRTDPETETAFYLVEGFDRPPTLVRADLRSGDRQELTRVEVEGDEESALDELVVRQAVVESTGGVEVPLFVCHREGIERDGDNPTVLHGYGGFRSSRPPNFDRFRAGLLADGGVYAQVCARGGHEYGEEWHEDGMGVSKQHTFDDFVAAGEYLCSAGYTNADRLAVTGRSNGGLSVGAVVTQRPDLWGAAVCSVPLLDMLRFHRLGMGAAWTAEYGDPADESDFETLRAYSLYHNVEEGVEYPPVLFTTGDEDTRVHPSHARKTAARMQAVGEGGPFLLRTASGAGHGSGPSVEAVIAEQTDRWTFLYETLGIDP
ncbi:prolyl oligopeptidase family serine peptidase [Halorussus salinus]|uniref:prolyl oligopeptidase family serine peptidase n=1 Tax=Halorussus salinus TaxID=1364935 RepID=UPI0010924845|nr:prolyl oligopeptidase family serine peptidase [Halorussus salinus]